MTAGYLRSPDIRGDLITFCAADDIWLAPDSGGRAWRLTDDQTPVRNPRFSPDGRAVAWASTRDSGWEIFVCDVDGGPVRRLTYFGHAATWLLGWADDNAVLVASAARSHERALTFGYRVGLDGSVTPLPYGPVAGVAAGENGVVVSSRAIRPAAEWKRYRGGTASKLWWDRTGDGRDYQRVLADIRAGLEAPSWVGEELIFTSDHLAELPGTADGQANLFSIPRSGLAEATAADLTQCTFHTAEQGYVREPVTDGSRVVYHSRGVLYLMADPGAEPQPIEISLPVLGSRRPRSLAPTENLTAVQPDQTATGSVVTWRGNAFYLSHREGPARALVASSAVRVREARPLGRTGQVVLVSDEAGEDRLELHPISGIGERRVVADLGLGRILHLAADPAGERVALISHDGRISVLDVGSGTVRQLGVSPDGEATGPTFSPDGRYLVWSQPVGQFHSQLCCADLAVGDGRQQGDRDAAVPLTSGRFADTSPAFTPDGKHLAFLSVRTFDPSYDVHAFEITFPDGTRPYLVPLSATEPAPFGPSVDGWALTDPEDKPASATDPETADADGTATSAAAQDKPATDEPPASPDLDLDGFEQRLVPFGVPAGNYRQLRAAKHGLLWIHEAPTHGVLGSGRAGVTEDKPADRLERYDLTKRSVEVLVDKLDDYAVSGDLGWIVVRDGDAVTVRPSDREIKDDDDPARVMVDLDRLRFELDPVAEWRQMFDENVRLMRDHYWRADLDGVDLDAVADRYRSVLDRLGSHDDLISVLWEFGAELNTSHAYASPPGPLGDQDRALGLLGADLVRAGEDWVIERILPGESSDPDARSPLQAAGVDARPGDRIVAVDGQPVDPQAGPAAALVGAAEKPVELLLRRPGRPAGRRVVVVPLAGEQQLRYQDWVASRKDYVARAGGGRIGYLHVPDMMAVGWAQLHRDLEQATRCEAVIADVRFNAGGHLSQLVTERLNRKVVAWDVGRHHAAAEEYPSQAPRGPVVLVANEYAGSDGDIVNGAAKAMGIGPVIGMRTWGGVVGIDGRFDLVDGTSVTQPRYAFWISGQGWGVENHGVDPDIEVPITPADWHAAADPQLDRAIAEALERLDRTPAATPPQPAPPRVR
ncbi:S41 family peptidase [Microlunatus soli]|uniref:Tricorn protease homolog n=1 Tax=Microlunatus soli TaxID=630515 RepID=A0A1H1PMR2_9ACTN|nr:S41 family peptidase [Microlunatus soli]SDS12347.1 tricorn protease [Microlunatus soli]